MWYKSLNIGNISLEFTFQHFCYLVYVKTVRALQFPINITILFCNQKKTQHSKLSAVSVPASSASPSSSTITGLTLDSKLEEERRFHKKGSSRNRAIQIHSCLRRMCYRDKYLFCIDVRILATDRICRFCFLYCHISPLQLEIVVLLSGSTEFLPRLGGGLLAILIGLPRTPFTIGLADITQKHLFIQLISRTQLVTLMKTRQTLI